MPGRRPTTRTGRDHEGSTPVQQDPGTTLRDPHVELSPEPVSEATAAETQSADSVVTGIVGDKSATASRSGSDSRRRGWFWHWNNIVTQYAPMLGLKGVGLLNSYTVWTDRREESPHRGYAFPSQQSEADFYGEDRAELITINKILVALDLIEIRKEMVHRSDSRGRRWKVPHNFYRVKDHGDGFNLSAPDVMRVVELAERDRNVYRYVRRMFSPKFSPIDPTNVWHDILDELRPTTPWQTLAERTARVEQRASARSRAGHAARRGDAGTGSSVVPNHVDSATPIATVIDSDNDSADVVNHIGLSTSVANINTGLPTDVEPGNNGSHAQNPASVERTNTAQVTSVEPGNTMYYQVNTTTTTGVDRGNSGGTNSPQGAGPGPVHDNQRDETTVTTLFEEANARPTTPAERRLLRQLAERFEPVAGGSGWRWLALAIDDAVAAGSTFVAPRRLREILNRWERDGLPHEYRLNDADVPHVPAGDAAARQLREAVTRPAGASHGNVRTPEMPNGRSGPEVWAQLKRSLGEVIQADRLDDLVGGAEIVGYDRGRVTIAVPRASQQEALTTTHHELVRRKLTELLRRPIQLEIVIARVGAGTVVSSEPSARQPRGRVPRDAWTAPVFAIEPCGMTNRQVWSAVIAELNEREAVGQNDIDTWLRDGAIVDQQDDGVVVLAVPHEIARRRATGRYRSAMREALRQVTGGDLELVVVLRTDWIRDTDPLTVAG